MLTIVVANPLAFYFCCKNEKLRLLLPSRDGASKQMSPVWSRKVRKLSNIAHLPRIQSCITRFFWRSNSAVVNDETTSCGAVYCRYCSAVRPTVLYSICTVSTARQTTCQEAARSEKCHDKTNDIIKSTHPTVCESLPCWSNST